jgi:hypothetical protein
MVSCEDWPTNLVARGRKPLSRLRPDPIHRPGEGTVLQEGWCTTLPEPLNLLFFRSLECTPSETQETRTVSRREILQLEGEVKQIEYNRYFPPDTQAAMFWLRNRRHKQWRERIEHEHSVTDDKLRELEEAGIRARNAHRR